MKTPRFALPLRLLPAILLLLVAGQPAMAAMAADIANDAAPGSPYAIVVNGDDSFTHNYNVSLALGALAQLRYRGDHVLLLAAKAPEAPEISPVRLPATPAGIRDAVRRLREKVTAADLLLVYLTGHGDREFGHTELSLTHGSISAEALARELSSIPFGTLIFISDTCYSGGFAEAMAKLPRNVVAVASVDAHHETRCEPFIRPLWGAVNDLANDRNGDGFVSIEEAFQVGAAAVSGNLAKVMPGVVPLYAAAGACKGRENRLAVSQR
ncbi:MAG TPA: hypothetical protein VOA87_00695 [Thermoanaerobaculia bacterium]|nr:hypothetical protein [Thermoanaerobaculia bacterium]